MGRALGRRSADFQSAPECRLEACATSNLRNREREVPLRILLRGGPAVFGRNEDGGLAGGAWVGSLRAMDVYERARESIDAAHSADPIRTPDGAAAELVYADRMEAWVVKLDPAASPILRLAARCQHLERWSVPRTSFPQDKPGYLAWRRSLYVKQAARAVELLRAAGVEAGEAEAVREWVSKSGLKTNPGTQALEEAACLVFLENEIAGFAEKHAGYSEEKYVEILRKTWRKMSPAAQEAARALALPPAVAALLQRALASG